MKKGLFLSFVIIAMMFASSGFANGPVLKYIPDVIIGDLENGASNNVFEFPHAFVFDDYVTDQDTTDPLELKWCFKILSDTTQTLTINGLTAEPGADFHNPSHLLNTVRGATATFRNETLSPSSGTPPYPEPTFFEDIRIALYVSDGTLVNSQEITVYTIDDCEDSYSYPPPPLYMYYEGFSGIGNWDCVNGVTRTIAPSSIAAFDSANSRIVCRFPSTNLGAIYYEWEQWNQAHVAHQDAMSYFDNNVYALRARMYANTNTAPGFRLRIQAQDNTWTNCLVLGATDPNQGGGLKIASEDFYAVFQPQGTTSNAFLSIDMYTALNNTGECYIDELLMQPLSLSDLQFTPVANISDFASWGQLHGGSVSAIIDSDSVTLPDPNESFILANGFVTFPTPAAKGDVYRINYQLSKSNSPERCEKIRLRANDTANPAYGPNFIFDDSISSSTHLTTSPKSFYLWHYAMNGRGTGAAPYNSDMAIALDTWESGSVSGTAADIILTGISIDKVANWPVLD